MTHIFREITIYVLRERDRPERRASPSPGESGYLCAKIARHRSLCMWAATAEVRGCVCCIVMVTVEASGSILDVGTRQEAGGKRRATRQRTERRRGGTMQLAKRGKGVARAYQGGR